MFPVDLPDVDENDLRSDCDAFLSSLESGPGGAEWFQSHTVKVLITQSNIRRLLVFEDPECPLLTLHVPERPGDVVAVHLCGQWWSVDQVFQTTDKSRSGLLQVRSVMERVVVFLLGQVLTEGEEKMFSPHPRSESCQLLWVEGEAVGFCSVKHKGSLCDGWSCCCYVLPVLDTVLVRRRRRRRGFGLRMLQDFCASFRSEEQLGVSAPLSPAMAAVCRCFLQQQPQQRERLWEVEAPGGWSQRRNIWLNIQLSRYSLVGVESKGASEGNEDECGSDGEKNHHVNLRSSDSSPDLDSPAGPSETRTWRRKRESPQSEHEQEQVKRLRNS